MHESIKYNAIYKSLIHLYKAPLSSRVWPLSRWFTSTFLKPFAHRINRVAFERSVWCNPQTPWSWSSCSCVSLTVKWVHWWDAYRIPCLWIRHPDSLWMGVTWRSKKMNSYAFELWCYKDSWESLGQQGVNPKGNQCWIFIGRTDAEAPKLWPPDAENWLIGKDWCWERLRAGEEGRDRGWDNWMAPLTQGTWVWANCRR